MGVSEQAMGENSHRFCWTDVRVHVPGHRRCTLQVAGGLPNEVNYYIQDHRIPERLFCKIGLPVTLVSDNGPQFTSHEFKTFMNSNGIKHKTTAPFKPSSNGQAERYVFTLKQALRAMKEYSGTIQQKLSTF
ncbi:hypothetical protein JTE90_025940 [Oedothorax gibbosus]|uniref:Integrase catalytic domain-containing protein n=1 Tax=Oedothorax gibbosus TaxID=931172 RepID=A0AAV6TM96_9ARAC|nr:hypothetical protein JTE90_025940 [Oedothorax gibbosus]